MHSLAGGYIFRSAKFRDSTAMQPKPDDQQRDEVLRRALATPPISNEEILRRSSQRSHRPRRVPKNGGGE
jgi:hypothetical protein